MERNELNRDGIFLLDTFQIDYYGTPVIFQVCKTKKDKVAVYELATKKSKINEEEVLIITDKIRASESSVLVPRRENTYQKSNFWVKTQTIDGEPYLVFDVSIDSVLYYKTILKDIKFPKTEKIFASKIENIKKYYWVDVPRRVEA